MLYREAADRLVDISTQLQYGHELPRRPLSMAVAPRWCHNTPGHTILRVFYAIHYPGVYYTIYYRLAVAVVLRSDEEEAISLDLRRQARVSQGPGDSHEAPHEAPPVRGRQVGR